MVASTLWSDLAGVRDGPLGLSHFSLCHALDGMRLKVVMSALWFHDKMTGPLKKRDSELCV